MKYADSQKSMIEKTYLMSCVVGAAFILLTSITEGYYMLDSVSAQITPSSTPMPASSTSPQSAVLPESLPPLNSEIRPVAQDIGKPLQNNTTSNITQLATIPSTINQPIVPASLGPVSTESDDDSDNNNDSGDDSNDGDSNDDSGSDDDGGDDSNDGDSGGDDDGGDDDSGDDDGDGSDGGSVAIAGGGGAFASAG